jgi:hypothetical protein
MKPRESQSSGVERASIRELIGGCSPLAKEILSYMARNPDAQDTLEGIVEWWLLEHRIRTGTTLVRKALGELAALGVVDETVTADRTRYRISPRYRDQLHALAADAGAEP